MIIKITIYHEILVNEITSDKIETSLIDQPEETNESETSVRRLSLFDNISLDSTNENIYQNDKTEPVISENINDSSLDEGEISKESSEKLEPEFSATDDDLEEDFNQESEEELLDIPTFLRRQAN